MNYRVLVGKEEIFEAACKHVLEGMHAADGHEESRIYRNIEASPAEYLIVSRWKDETAFQEFISSDAFKKVTNWGREHILAGRPTHTTYHEG